MARMHAAPAIAIFLLLVAAAQLSSALLPYAQSLSRRYPSSKYSYQTYFFTQTLDHFNFRKESFTTFQQRYLISTQHWGGAQQHAPIFMYCGNEGDITWFAENTGFMWEIAPRFGAMVLFLEHRYYGQSVPDAAVRKQTAETLGYLTAEQALADYATLIYDLKKNLSAWDSPVVAFGGSYGGMLAAWFRLKYPHVVVGSLAASAPILQFGNIVSPYAFAQIVSNDFKQASASCFETIRSSWDALEAAGNTSAGLKTLSGQLRFCSTADLGTIQSFFYTAWIYMAMTDYPYPADFLVPLPAHPVNRACKAIDDMPAGTDVISRVLAGVNVYYNTTGNVTCFGQTDASSSNGLGAFWGWQACTEMILPIAYGNDSMFVPEPFNLSAIIRDCEQYYGVSPRPDWILQEFGGQHIRTVLKHYASNIVFSNGLLDPWSGGGVTEDISDSIVALVTSEGAHHLDLRPSTDQDPEWLIEQRQKEIKHITNWLRQYYIDRNATGTRNG